MSRGPHLRQVQLSELVGIVSVGLVAIMWTRVLSAAGIDVSAVAAERIAGGFTAAAALTAAALFLRAATRRPGRDALGWALVGAASGIWGWVTLSSAGMGDRLGNTDTMLGFALAYSVFLVGIIITRPGHGGSPPLRNIDAAIVAMSAVAILWSLPIHSRGFAPMGSSNPWTIDAGPALVVAIFLVALVTLVRRIPGEHCEFAPLIVAILSICAGAMARSAGPISSFSDDLADGAVAGGGPAAGGLAMQVSDAGSVVGALLLVIVARRLLDPGTRPRRRRPLDSLPRSQVSPAELASAAALAALMAHQAIHRDSPLPAVVIGTVIVALVIGRLAVLEHEQRALTESLRTSVDQLYRDARMDTLTGLGNRLALDEHLADLLRTEPPSAQPDDGRALWVFFVDVDHFKRFNDALGHQVGDAVLVEVADRLRSVFSDAVHRTGGDEFVAVGEGLDHDSAVALADAVSATFAAPLVVAGHELNGSVSIGLARAERADDPAAGQTVRQHADLALYRAKELGRGGHQVYAPALQERADHQVALRQSLHGANERGELEVHYRPAFALSSGRLVGAGATVHWRSPEHGLMGPEVLGPVATEAGLLPMLDALLFDDVTSMLLDTGTDPSLGPPLWIAVQLGHDDLMHPKMTDLVLRVAHHERIDTARLHIEITESTVLSDGTLEVVAGLRQLGVHITVERFGTGPSSLLRLGHYPASTVKVDGSFVDGVGRRRDDTVILTALAGLTEDLGLELAADGISEEFQARYLAELGCTVGQGRLFGDSVGRAALLAAARAPVGDGRSTSEPFADEVTQWP